MSEGLPVLDTIDVHHRELDLPSCRGNAHHLDFDLMKLTQRARCDDSMELGKDPSDDDATTCVAHRRDAVHSVESQIEV